MDNKFWDEYTLIASITKSKNKEIRIGKAKKMNNIGIDIREYYKNGDSYLPGSRGLLVPITQLDSFKEVVKLL